MNTDSNIFTETTIVAFHIGRGGHFHNAGHLFFIGEERIGKYTNDLFLSYEYERDCKTEAKERIGDYLWEHGSVDGRKDLECYFIDLITDGNFEKLEQVFGISADDLGEQIYTDCNGRPVGLSEREALTGVGSINIDNECNSTYTKYLCDCNETELQLIVDCNYYIDQAIVDYAREQLGIVDEEEETEE